MSKIQCVKNMMAAWRIEVKRILRNYAFDKPFPSTRHSTRKLVAVALVLDIDGLADSDGVENLFPQIPTDTRCKPRLLYSHSPV